MKIEPYLERINYDGGLELTAEVLKQLHRRHVYHVPFENLDVQNAQPILIAESSLYKKIVENHRGGFCYELNFLFQQLLKAIGFNCWIVSARIFDNKGEPGAPYDHMSVLVELEQTWLVDVGFGDLFLEPIALTDEVQTDGRNYFKIEKAAEGEFILLMSSSPGNFTSKYIFTTKAEEPESFDNPCLLKQTDPDCYFVKNLICTQPTLDGRFTIFNQKLIATVMGEKKEITIRDEEQMNLILMEKFGIVIS